MKPCRVLVVDDSATMRALIASALSNDPSIKVVGEAADPLEAREAIKRLDPDVVTLDIEMPKMNGLDFLERIMRLRPTRVIIVSSQTEKCAATTIRALEIGAYDCFAKPSARNGATFDDLVDRVKAVAMALPPTRKLSPERVAPAKRIEGPNRYQWDGRTIFVGSSMGGVEALFELLSQFPEDCPPTVITQHMPPLFTKNFAERLNRFCRPAIREAYDGATLAQGQVYIAPGGGAHLEIERGAGLRCRLRTGEPVSGHRPSIDVMFRAAANVVGAKAIGVILTGMGRDGANGLLAMREAGAETVGQDEATSLIYGMPKVAMEIGAVGKQFPLGRIAHHILQVTNTALARETCQF